MNVVFREGGIEGADEGGVEDCRREGESDDEEGRDGGDDCSSYAAEAGEEREETDEDFNDGGDQGDDVGDEHPFSDDAVGVESVAEGGGEEGFDIAVVEAPDCDRVEPEFVGVRGAVFYIFGDAACGVVGVVSGAVVPEGDVVEVCDVEG